MRRRRMLIAVLFLAAFGLGILVGLRSERSRRGMSHSASSATLPSMAGCVGHQEAGNHVGQSGCVVGRVVRVFTSQAGNTFIDFCPDYRTCPFTTVIFASDKSKFGDLTTLGGRQLEIRGPITAYEGRAEIIIHAPEQIRLVP